MERKRKRSKSPVKRPRKESPLDILKRATQCHAIPTEYAKKISKLRADAVIHHKTDTSHKVDETRTKPTKVRHDDDSDSAEEEDLASEITTTRKTHNRDMKRMRKTTVDVSKYAKKQKEGVFFDKEHLVAKKDYYKKETVDFETIGDTVVELTVAEPVQQSDDMEEYIRALEEGISGPPGDDIIQILEERISESKPRKGEEEVWQKEAREDSEKPMSEQKAYYIKTPKVDDHAYSKAANTSTKVATILDEMMRMGHNKMYNHDFPALKNHLLRPRAYSVPTTDISGLESVMNNIEQHDRKQEDDLLRPPDSSKGERECLKGGDCEATKIQGCVPIILREMLSAKERLVYQMQNKMPTEKRLCIMCARLQIQRIWLSIRVTASAGNPKMNLQTFSNITDVEGEYSFQDVMMSSDTVHHGIFAPVVMHCKQFYSQEKKNGVWCYRQKYKKPGFQRRSDPDPTAITQA
jgi:hypothetical protein